ncbi:MAG: hypothetical protein WBM14_09480 [Terracidiphilus sp.]|jgi:hypothetical protein
MASNREKNPYRTAYNRASSELRKIFGELEQLSLQRDRVEKLVQALKPTIESDGDGAWNPRQETSSLPGLTVVTRINSAGGTQEAGN